MTREVLVSLSGLQKELEEDDALEVVTPAVYCKRDGKHYIRYEEFQEDSAEPTKVLLKLSEEKVEVTKQGESNVHMLFEQGKQYTTMYQMPFGTMAMGIHTTSMNMLEQEDEINAEILYGLDINYSHVSDCQVKIKVSARA